VMTVPLILLAVGAAFAGFAGHSYFIDEGRAAFWAKSVLVLPSHPALADREELSWMLAWLPTLLAVLGIGLAFWMYVFSPGIAGRLARQFSWLYRFMLNKWYFDELYDFLLVRPAFRIGRGLWLKGDGAIIDGAGPDGLAAGSRQLAAGISRIETGYLYHYAFAMLIGVAAFVTWYMLMRG
jgi:NADH-quinone oxidoreductase subunit L